MKEGNARSFLSNVMALAGSSAFGQALALLAAPLLTRLYSPTEFGNLALFVAVLGLLTIIGSLKYDLAIPVAPNDHVAAQLMVVGTIATIVTSLTAATIIWLLTLSGWSWSGISDIGDYIWLLPIGMLTVSLFDVYSAVAARLGRFTVIARTRLFQTISATGTQVAAGFVGLGSLGLILGQMLHGAVGATTLGLAAFRKYLSFLTPINGLELRKAARQYVEYPLLAAPAGLMNSGSLLLPAILLTALYDPSVAGWFALSERVIRGPLSLVSRSVGQVFYAVGAQDDRVGGKLLLSRYLKITRSLFAAGILPTVVLALLAPVVFAYVFGDEWRTAGEYTQILAPMFLIQFVLRSVSQTLYIVGWQRAQLIWDSVRVLLIAAGFFTCYVFDFEPFIAVALYSALMSISYVLLYWLQRTALRAEPAT